MKRSTFIASLALLSSFSMAEAQFVTHGHSPNVIVFEEFISSNTETNGALWVGGYAQLNNYSVGVSLTGAPANHPSLIVGGNLTHNNGQVFNGSAFVGGNVNVNGFNVLNGSLVTEVPVDFVAIKTSATNTSTAFSQMGDSYGSLEITPWNTMNLTLQSGLNIIHIDGNTLSKINTFNIQGNADSTVVFNIGDVNYMHEAWAGMNENQLVGITSEQILFNFYAAEEVKLDRLSGILGSVLAPWADVTGGYGSFRGQLIAESYRGNMEFYNNHFNWVQPIPEPSTIAALGLGGLGLLLTGRQIRRRKKKAA